MKLILSAISCFFVVSFATFSFAQGPPPGGPGGMLRMFPLMKALDTDGDGTISAEEIARAPETLRSLDKNGDGALTEDELAPDLGGFGRGRGGRGARGGRGGGRGNFGGGAARRLSPEDLEIEMGAADIPDRAMFETLSYQGDEVMIDTHLTGLEFVKFQIENATTEPQTYFINTEKIRAHPMFMEQAGLPRGGEGQMRGVLVYRPLLKAPNGQPGHYTFEFEPNDSYSYEMIQLAFDELCEHAPILEGRLSYHALPRARAKTLSERDKYDAAQLPIFLAEDTYADIAFLPLNRKATFGRLRLMEGNERPGPRDVVLYRNLPNEMPRVAGIITSVRQTPLSHVNLRAVQDGVPNAFIRDASTHAQIAPLIGKYVAYSVDASGFDIREATVAEVEAHFAAMRPSEPQTPVRDLSVTEIRPLRELTFGDAKSFGVKTANLAAMHHLDLPEGLLPDGFGIPFHFYDAYMKHNGFDVRAGKLDEIPGFDSDSEVRAKALKEFRRAIARGAMPEWMLEQLATLQSSFPEGTRLRCRSSTNNEDLPGFSGAGLYGSVTHRPKEGHIGRSVKQVYASLWNFRAYEERKFYRIDHLATAMGVLVHPNFSDEQANGVAVTEDIVYQTADQVGRTYYVNAQIGESLVTNPDKNAIPEELLLSPRNSEGDRVMQRSNQIAANETVLSTDHIHQLRRHLKRIHDGFRRHYGKSGSDPFSMEVEFKITELGDLSIKQARPWVYDSATPKVVKPRGAQSL